MATRSARGSLVDFDLLTIKAELASIPVPRQVQNRQAIMNGITQEVQEPLIQSTTQEENVEEVPQIKAAPKRK